MRSGLCIFLCALLVVSPASAEKKTQGEKIREKLVAIQAGGSVEVIQKDGRWKGRLGELGPESFTVQVAGKERIEERSFRYDDVRNVKDMAKKGMSTGTKVVVGVLTAVGAWTLIVIIYMAAHGWDS